MPFCAFVSDQQMSLRLKAILESLAPDNSYVVSLYPAPIRQLATCDIGWGNVNNPHGRRRNSENATSTHSAFLTKCRICQSEGAHQKGVLSPARSRHVQTPANLSSCCRKFIGEFTWRARRYWVGWRPVGRGRNRLCRPWSHGNGDGREPRSQR